MNAGKSGRWAFGLTVAGFGWGLASILGAFLVPVYSGEIVRNGLTESTSGTLVGENGIWVIGLVALPAALALIAWFGLRRKCSIGSRSGSFTAWTAITVLVAFALVSALSIGAVVFPAALLLIVAASLTRLRRERHGSCSGERLTELGPSRRSRQSRERRMLTAHVGRLLRTVKLYRREWRYYTFREAWRASAIAGWTGYAPIPGNRADADGNRIGRWAWLRRERH